MLESVKPDAQMIFQEFMNNSMGTDVHVLVIGGRVVGAVKRTSKGDFRSNVESQVEAYKLPATGEYIALSVVRLLDLEIARVDLLFDNEAQTRFRVCNVKLTPGFEEFEKYADLDAANALLQFIRVNCGFAPKSDDDDDEEIVV